MTKKLAIVGSHPDTRANAPFYNQDFDIWVFNEAAAQDWCKRWTACFQLHKPEIYTSPNNRSDKKHWDWLQQNHGDKKIYMQDVDPRVPNSVRFPIERVKDLVGWNYFSSSFTFALAMAAIENYTHIEIYGSDLTSNTEYMYQADGLRSWIMFLKGRGVQVEMKCWPGAFDQPLYGYEGEIRLGAEFYQKRIQMNGNAWEAAEKALKNTKQATLKNITAGQLDRVRDNIEKLQDLVMQAGKYSGAMSVAEKYLGYGDKPDDRQEFEISAARAQKDGREPQIMMYRAAGMIEYIWNVALQTGDNRAKAQLVQMLETLLKHGYEAGAMDGINTENLFYMGVYDGLVQAAGGQKSIEAINGNQ
jgi:hypothetical protein